MGSTAEWGNRIVGHDDVAPDQLLANPANARRHPGSQRDALRESLGRVGWVAPIIVNRTTGFVVDGHARIEEALTRGEATVPVTYVELTPEEERFVLATFDPISAMADTDRDLLADLIDGLDFESDALRDTMEGLAGNVEQLKPGDTDPDDAPPLPTEAVTQPGDVWILGAHRLVCGDSTHPEPYDQALAGQPADMVWTDPPYGVAYVGKTADALTLENDDLDPDQLEQLLRDAFALAFAHTKRGGVWFVAAPGGPLFARFAGPLSDLGVWRQTIVWLKDQFVMSRQDYHNRTEPLFAGWKPGDDHVGPLPDDSPGDYADDAVEHLAMGWKPGDGHRRPRTRKQDNVWEFPRPKANREHPTMKPVALIQRAVANHTRRGEHVLDPFGGSGSTLVACEQLGRVAHLIELDPRYVDVICRRFQEHTGIKPVVEATGQPHDFTVDQESPQ